MSAKIKVAQGYSAKTICGHVLTLRTGESYLASVQLEVLGAFHYGPVTVSIQRLDERYGWQPIPSAYVSNLTKEEAIEFLSAFNNGRVSFRGRKWGSK